MLSLSNNLDYKICKTDRAVKYEKKDILYMYQLCRQKTEFLYLFYTILILSSRAFDAKSYTGVPFQISLRRAGIILGAPLLSVLPQMLASLTY